jgi:hypothetical protein
MGGKSAVEIEGLEFDWLASNADGHVALFSTAGGGFAPPEFLQDTDAHDAAIKAVLALPPSTHALFAPELASHLVNTWCLVAERGLWAFDSDPNGAPYSLVAAPATGTRVTLLPERAAAVAQSLKLPHLRFAELKRVPEELLRWRP